MKNKKKKARLGTVILTAVIALVLCGLLFWGTMSSNKKIEKLDEELTVTEQQISAEERRRTEIENEIKYRQTDDYIEDEARKIFGLRDPDDTIFLPGEEVGNRNGADSQNGENNGD